MPPPSNAVLLERLTIFEDSIREVKTLMTKIDERLQDIDKREVRCQVLMDSKIEAAHRRIDVDDKTLEKHDNRLVAIEEFMPPLKELISIKGRLILVVALSGFVGTTLGGLLIAFIFYKLMGSAP